MLTELIELQFGLKKITFIMIAIQKGKKKKLEAGGNAN